MDFSLASPAPLLSSRSNPGAGSPRGCSPGRGQKARPGPGLAGRAHGQLQQDDLPVLRGVALVDVAGEAGRAVEGGRAVLAGEDLRRVQQAQVPLLAALSSSFSYFTIIVGKVNILLGMAYSN